MVTVSIAMTVGGEEAVQQRLFEVGEDRHDELEQREQNRARQQATSLRGAMSR